ncbi:hypothetical protein MHU86_5803 [Fragilaria crotonensis]|nr:hypothetical protein MHU86_5803 [Fragilaria crotonensis]
MARSGKEPRLCAKRGEASCSSHVDVSSSDDNEMITMCDNELKRKGKVVVNSAFPFDDSSFDDNVMRAVRGEEERKTNEGKVVALKSTSWCRGDKSTKMKSKGKEVGESSTPFDDSSCDDNVVRAVRGEERKTNEGKVVALKSTSWCRGDKSTKMKSKGKEVGDQREGGWRVLHSFDDSSYDDNVVRAVRGEERKTNEGKVVALKSTSGCRRNKSTKTKSKGKEVGKSSTPFDDSSCDDNVVRAVRGEERKTNEGKVVALKSTSGCRRNKSTKTKSKGKEVGKSSTPFDDSSCDDNVVRAVRGEERKTNEGKVVALKSTSGCRRNKSTKTKSKGKEVGKSSTPCDDNAKLTQRNKVLNPCRIGVNGPFGRTLPGELARSIIVAGGFHCKRVVCHKVPPLFGVDTPMDPQTEEMHGVTTTRKCRQAERIAAWENKESIVGILRDHPSRSLATHAQVAHVIAKSLPLHSVDTFLTTFNSFVPPPPKKGTKPSLLSQPVVYREKIMKTPVDWITSALEHTFGLQHVSFSRCNSPAQIYDASDGESNFEIVVMDCVLARTIKLHKVKRKKAAKLLDTPVKMYSYVSLHLARQGTTDYIPAIGEEDLKHPGEQTHKNYQEEQNCVGLIPKRLPEDDFFRACVVLIPDAGVFYCHRERRKQMAGLKNSHIPIDMNWLRLRCNSRSTIDNWFSKGSYISRIADGDCCVWKWGVRRSETNLLAPNCGSVGMPPRLKGRVVHKTHQLTDEDGPALPPDFVDGEDLSTRYDCNRLTGLYRFAYCTSNSARRGCRHYARGFLHKNIDPKTTYVIDPTKCAEIDLLVDVLIRAGHGNNKVALHRKSVVRISYLPVVVGKGCKSLMQDINNHCNAVKKFSSSGARAGKGDLGKMHPIGSRIDTSGNKVRYRTSSDASSVHRGGSVKTGFGDHPWCAEGSSGFGK